MRVVVTGGDGFAGRWLCRSLVQDQLWVSAWVRRLPADPLPGVHYRIQDVRDAAGCRSAMKADAPHQVFHLAAITHLGQAKDQPIAAHDTNVQGTANVMAAVPGLATAVYASTCHVYGPPEHLPMGEAHPCAPQGVYARTKLEAESVARACCEQVVIARAFHHTGAGQSSRFALADWAEKVSRGQEVLTGDLSLRRDYTDVRDICGGYRLLAQHGLAHEVYNLCSGEAVPLQELLEGMAPPGAVAYRQDPERIRRGDVRETRGDPSKAEALGWRRHISRAQMIQDLVAGVCSLA
jgi:GDP-4-dehydro-6-deoxy-D-mannose reductase